MNISKSQTAIRLPLLNCFGADFLHRHFQNDTFNLPSKSTSPVLCSPSSGTCYTCPLVSGYLSSEISQGRMIVITLWIFITIVGLFAVLTNILNIILLLGKSPPCGPSLASLLIPLSIFDMIASGFAIGYSTFSVMILENMSRSWVTMQLYHFSLVTYLLGRTGSLFIAVLITLERYLVVAHPFKTKLWLTLNRTRTSAGVVCLIACVTNLPRYFTVKLVENVDAKDIPELRDFPYLFQSTWLGILLYKKVTWLGKLHFTLDFLLPLPILLILNIMLFYKITQVNRMRRNLLHNRSQSSESDISAAKMFAVLVSVLLLSHVFPVCFYVYLSIYKVAYKELSFGTTFSISLNSSIHVLIYFIFGKQFRLRFLHILGKIREQKLCKAKVQGVSGSDLKGKKLDHITLHDVIDNLSLTRSDPNPPYQ